MKIYTRTGDQAQTSLFGGERVDKDAPRVEACGTIDELNSLLGAALAFCHDDRVQETLHGVQADLFALGADLATAGHEGARVRRLGPPDWARLEATIDKLNQSLTPLRHFLIPGGSPGAALIQLARAVCRRAERRAVSAAKADANINPQILVYLNRLSDLLFVLARVETTTSGTQDMIWRKDP